MFLALVIAAFVAEGEREGVKIVLPAIAIVEVFELELAGTGQCINLGPDYGFYLDSCVPADDNELFWGDPGQSLPIGDHKGRSAVWVDFDTGARRLLDVEFAVPHLRPRGPQDTTTPVDPRERCDYCGGRPVVVTVTGSDKVRRCCDTHRSDLAKDLRP